MTSRPLTYAEVYGDHRDGDDEYHEHHVLGGDDGVVAGGGSERRTSWTAGDLLAADFPPPAWAVPGVIPEGLTLLAGAPKLGKSWLALNLAAAVAAGGRALGRVQVDQGEVLYLALEDPPRRLASRLRLILNGDAAPHGLTFETEWPPLADGGADQLDAWLAEHPGRRLVVVDVVARVRGQVDDRVNRYDADYHAMAELKKLADRHGVAILVLHHTRKAGAEDYLDTVSGTHGLAGAADAVAVMTRARTSADAVLQVTGRDVEERSYALRFSPSIGTWTLLDEPPEVLEMGDTRRRIHALLEDAGPMTPKQIAEALGLDANTAKVTAWRMAEKGQLDTADGQYFLPVTPVTPVTEGDEGYTGYTGYTPSEEVSE